MAKNIRDIAIAAFFFALAGFLIMGMSLGKDAFRDWKSIKAAQIENQHQTVTFLKEFAERGYDDFARAKKMELEHIQNLTQKAEQSGLFLEELGILIAARMLEDGRALPASTADEFVRESIQSIKGNHSERVGKLLDAVNEKYLREHRNASASQLTGPPVYHELPQLVVDLKKTGDRTNYIKLKVVVEIVTRDLPLLQAQELIITNKIQSFLRLQTRDDVAGGAGTEHMRNGITKIVKEVMGEVKTEGVLFREILFQ